MSDGNFYLYANVACNLVMSVCGAWLLTDRHLHRVLRACYAFIAAGAVVNLFGMTADVLGIHDISYGHIWPGELATNFGMAVMMASSIYRTTHRSHPATPPK